ncbi:MULTISPECIES: hypothetical protein [unclassified Microcoleus]|uniref:hypothetical protein n=1 Tax=unclassified Microcoleus TaxID=2642155 RepID=UPI002FD724D2
MDDASLCQLIREALHSPEKAEILAFAIDQLPEVKRYLDKGWLPYYDEALPVTERDVKRNINKFPQIYRLNLETTDCQNASETAIVRKRFISWVMMILRLDCYDVKRGQKNRPRTVSLSDPAGINQGGTIEDTIPDKQSLNGIGTLIADEELQENQQQEQELKRLIKTLVCYPEGYPHCTCYELIQRRLLKTPPQQWKEIAIELQIPYGTVTAHWNRKCKKRLEELSKKSSNK